MRLPFRYRLRWIRLKDRWHDHKPMVRAWGWASTGLPLAIIALIAIASLLIGCGAKSLLPGGISTPQGPSPTPSAVIPKPSRTPTDMPTPTTTPSPSPTPINPWENFPAPVEVSAIEIRRPARLEQDNEHLINVLLLGSDQRPNTYGHRTDVMLLVSIDTEAKSVKLLSFPRDLYLYIPGWRVDRINVADGIGGPEMVSNTILYNFGLQVDHWVRLDFAGFKGIIDTLGGIEVEVGGYLQDQCGRAWSYSPGVYHMDGFQALCYARMRKTTGDFDRLRREQEISIALFKEIVSIDGLVHIPELYREYQRFIETDMSPDDVLLLLPVAAKLAADPSSLERYDLGTGMASLWSVPASGASVVLPDWERIETMLQTSFDLRKQG